MKRFGENNSFVLTSLETLVELGVSSNRYAFGVTNCPQIINLAPYMKIHRLKAALSKAQAEVAKTEKAAKAAATLAASLKMKVCDAKRAFKETRRTYKQVRRFFRTAAREQKQADKIFQKVLARLEKLQAKTKKAAGKAKQLSSKKPAPTRAAAGAKSAAKASPTLVQQPRSTIAPTVAPKRMHFATPSVLTHGGNPVV